MTTYDSGSNSATGTPQRPAGRSSVRLVELERPRSCICQQNRLRTVLQLRLRQLEQDRRATLARITHTQRQFQQRLALKPDRRTSVPQQRLGTSFFDEESVTEREDDNDDDDDGETSKCLCDCCRYGLWTGKTKTINALEDSESITPGCFSRSDTVCPIVKSRGTAGIRCYDKIDNDAKKRFNVAIRRSKTTI